MMKGPSKVFLGQSCSTLDAVLIYTQDAHMTKQSNISLLGMHTVTTAIHYKEQEAAAISCSPFQMVQVTQSM